jgi:hypothetical protein
MPMKETTRINLEVTPEYKQTLVDLKNKTGASSIVEVFKRAIAVFATLQQESATGSSIIIRRQDGAEERILFL